MANSLVLIHFIANLTTFAAAIASLADTILNHRDRRAHSQSIRQAHDGEKDDTGPSAPDGPKSPLN